MGWFLWTLIALLTVSCAGKLIWLVTGVFPPRKPYQEALDVVINGALIVWAAVLLTRA
jgi:transglutaminase-like putative cysteine protease